MENMNLDFSGLYNRRPEPKYRPKSAPKRAKKKVIKKRKKKRVTKQWDDSLSNLNQHRLSPTRQLTKKLNAVSKHRHYAKDLVQEQKRKAMERRRIALEEKEIEQEQKQLIRRKQLLLRKHKIPNLKRTFPVFTSGRNQYDDTNSDDDTDSDDDQEYESDINESEESQTGIETGTKKEMTLKALSTKLTTLEDELETMKMENKNEEERVLKKEKILNECNVTLDYASIEKTIQAATAQASKQKKPIKPLHIKLPDMPNIDQSSQSQISNDQISNKQTSHNQPPQLSESESPKNESNDIQQQQKEQHKVNLALNSLDVPSLLMILDKLKIYFKEMQSEKKQNEEFRTTLLESVNAQNTQILHLLSSLASQQKQVDHLKLEISTLKSKLEKYEDSNINNNDKPQWNNTKTNMINSNDIASLRDIRNVIEESRNNSTDWKSISNEYSTKGQKAYTIQKHQHRSFIPSISEEAIESVPPQPVPKPNKKNNNDYIITNYPKVRIERHRK